MLFRRIAVASNSTLLIYLFALCIALPNLPSSFCTGLDIPPGAKFVRAADPSIEYNPPLSIIPAVWNVFELPGNEDSPVSGMEASDPQASVSITIQGTSIQFYALVDSSFPSLSVMLDSTQIMQPDNSEHNQKRKEIVPFPIDGSEVDPLVNHTVVIRKASNASSDSSWNILGFSFTPPQPSAPPLPSTTLSTTSNVQPPPSQADAGASTIKKSRQVSGGAVAGIVLGLIFAIGLAGCFVWFRRRRRQMTVITPEPLIISPTEERQDRSHFSRLYSNLPHFTAPSSIWPTSVIRGSTVGVSTLPATLPIARESLHVKVTPFTLPALPPRVVAPSPPKRLKPRRPVFSAFFVANPSSRSNRSERSQSIKDERVLEKDNGLDMLAAGGPTPKVINAIEKVSQEQHGTIGVGKGKERAIDFEIDPAPATRSKMSRKQSLRRFFFTTNPNPSTSSSSSASSSRKARNYRRAAVAEYVREQMRRKPPTRMRPGLLPFTLSVPEQASLHSVPVPEREVPIDATRPVQQTVSALQLPRKNRKSQTYFFTANPSPSMHDLASEHAEADSVASEMPLPKKDKGKGRAF